MFSRNHKFPEIHSSKAYVVFLDESVEASFFLFESCTKACTAVQIFLLPMFFSYTPGQPH